MEDRELALSLAIFLFIIPTHFDRSNRPIIDGNDCRDENGDAEPIFELHVPELCHQGTSRSISNLAMTGPAGVSMRTILLLVAKSFGRFNGPATCCGSDPAAIPVINWVPAGITNFTVPSKEPSCCWTNVPSYLMPPISAPTKKSFPK